MAWSRRNGSSWEPEKWVATEFTIRSRSTPYFRNEKYFPKALGAGILAHRDDDRCIDLHFALRCGIRALVGRSAEISDRITSTEFVSRGAVWVRRNRPRYKWVGVSCKKHVFVRQHSAGKSLCNYYDSLGSQLPQLSLPDRKLYHTRKF